MLTPFNSYHVFLVRSTFNHHHNTRRSRTTAPDALELPTREGEEKNRVLPARVTWYDTSRESDVIKPTGIYYMAITKDGYTQPVWSQKRVQSGIK